MWCKQNIFETFLPFLGRIVLTKYNETPTVDMRHCYYNIEQHFSDFARKANGVQTN